MTTDRITVTAIALPGFLFYRDPEDPTVICHAAALAEGGYEAPQWFDHANGGYWDRGGTDHGMCCPSMSAQERFAACRLFAEDGDAPTEVLGEAMADAVKYEREALAPGYQADLSPDEMRAPMTAPLVKVDPFSMEVIG